MRLIALLLPVIFLSTACTAQPVRDGAPKAGTMIVHPADGALMVWVPASEFEMGMNPDTAMTLAQAWGYDHYHKFAGEEWFPARQVWTPGYFVDVYEVTVGQWKQFVEKAKHESPWKSTKFASPPKGDPTAYDLYPVVRVMWDEAQKYANYMQKSLPTEAEWEKAARGSDGRWFPWGNELPKPGMGSFSKDVMGKQTRAYPVGSFPENVSPFGCYDMSGNVYEWTSDWFEPYPNNPEYERLLSYTGHTNGVLRGGSFYHAKHALCSAKRFGFKPDETYFHVGFRTVWHPPTDYFQTDAFEQAKAAVPAALKAIEAQRAKTKEMARNF